MQDPMASSGIRRPIESLDMHASGSFSGGKVGADSVRVGTVTVGR